MRVFKFLLFLMIMMFAFVVSKAKMNVSLSDGINFIANDSSMYVELGMVVQPRTELKADLEKCPKCNDVYAESYLRRVRLKFSGWLINSSLTYYLQLGLSNEDMKSSRNPETDNPSSVMDAWIQWEFADGFWLWFGQGKIYGCLSRMMSFQDLNFLERSIAEESFTLYRDIGAQLINEWSISDFTVKEAISLTHGEGKNWESFTDKGYNYSGRIEIYPFGKFANDGERFEMDREFEKKPKLVVGANYNYNDNCHREMGTRGNELYEARNQTTFLADFLFKYKGLAAMGEYYQREADEPITENFENETRYVYAGDGWSFQISRMLGEKSALALRISRLSPDEDIQAYEGFKGIYEYALGYTYFIYENKIKFQTDASYFNYLLRNDEISRDLRMRMNVVFSF